MQLGPLGIQPLLGGQFLLHKDLAFALKRLNKGIEFLLADFEFGLEPVQGEPLLFELALISRQLNLVLLEPGDQAPEIRICAGGSTAWLLVGIRFSHARLPSSCYNRCRVTEHPPAFASQCTEHGRLEQPSAGCEAWTYRRKCSMGMPRL